MMAGNPNWWSIDNNMHHPQSQQLIPHQSSPQYLYDSSSFVDHPQHLTQEYPRSWSQLLIGGLANDPEETLADNPSYQDKKLDNQNWEGQILNPCLTRGVNINNNIVDDEFQVDRKSWSQVIIPNSSPSSSVTCLTTSLLNFSNHNCKLEMRNQLPESSSECNRLKTAESVAKKPKIQQSTTQTSMKVRKEKLGDRITALHQLVSPFGKTDTASVLSESVGYIRFLQTQIQALSSPYLGNVASSRNTGHQQSFDSQDQPKDLRSRGLCLVPISCTIHVASDNGADYWASVPASVREF